MMAQDIGHGDAPREDELEIFVLTGATASGKSSVGLMLAERLGGEIVSLDSMKVYRGMDIGTAKPTAEDRAVVAHHLIDLRDPHDGYTVHDFLRDADAAARGVQARGRRVIFEGGTPLYLKAFLDGLFEGPDPDPALRARLEQDAERLGLSHLHGRLVAVDPEAGARIHPNDKRRIVRALEVYEQTGVPISEHQKQFGVRRAHVKAHLVSLVRPKEEMVARIGARVDVMIDAGWIGEAEALMRLDPPVCKSASGALGYRELWSHLRGEIDLDEAKARIRAETWRFVRRQSTWLRSFDDLVWVDAGGDAVEDAARVERLWME